MKLKYRLLFGIVTISFFIYSFTFETKEDADSFVLVELYTSQGCSSCPKADKVLEEINTIYKDKNVITLGFHVDYWDRLGWKDTFSKHLFTQRQYSYSQQFKNSSVYTPQMVINGETEFVGSDKVKALRFIEQKMNKKAAVKINGSIIELTNKLSINYKVSPVDYELYDINVAFVRNHQKVAIKRGENWGKKIAYHNIVIDFKSTSLVRKNGKFMIDIPKNYIKEAYSVVLFLQEKNNGSIVGATKLN